MKIFFFFESIRGSIFFTLIMGYYSKDMGRLECTVFFYYLSGTHLVGMYHKIENLGSTFSDYKGFPDVDPLVLVVMYFCNQSSLSVKDKVKLISKIPQKIIPINLPANFPAAVISSYPKTMHLAPNPRFSVLWQFLCKICISGYCCTVQFNFAKVFVDVMNLGECLACKNERQN